MKHNYLRALAGLIGLSAVLALSGCAPLAPGFYDAAPINEPGLASCIWSRRFSPPIIYQESDFIRAYFEPADLAAYRQPGWFVLTMPVTDGDACAGGRNALGTPKVMRRITLERGADRYMGTSYARDGRTPEFTLKMEIGEPGEAAREVLRFASPPPDFYLLLGRVLKVGGLPRSVVELESGGSAVWKVRLGQARLEFPREQESLLHRLGVGQPLAAYWGQLRYRYSITPR